MEKIKKALNFKIISLLIAFVFGFETISYATSDAKYNKTSLRVPIGRVHDDVKHMQGLANGKGIIVKRTKEQIYALPGGIWDVVFSCRRVGLRTARIYIEFKKDFPESEPFTIIVEANSTQELNAKFDQLPLNLSRMIKKRVPAIMIERTGGAPKEVVEWPTKSNEFRIALNQTRLTMLNYLGAMEKLMPVLENRGTKELQNLIVELVARSERSLHVVSYIIRDEGMFEEEIEADMEVADNIKTGIFQGLQSGDVSEISDNTHKVGDIWLLDGKVFVISDIEDNGRLFVAYSLQQVKPTDKRLATRGDGNQLLEKYGEHIKRYRLSEPSIRPIIPGNRQVDVGA